MIKIVCDKCGTLLRTKDIKDGKVLEKLSERGFIIDICEYIGPSSIGSMITIAGYHLCKECCDKLLEFFEEK